MSDYVCVLLSQKGESLKVFMRGAVYADYEEISDISQLNNFENLWIVEQHRDLLEQLISSHDPLTNLAALRNIQLSIEFEGSSASQNPPRKNNYNYYDSYLNDYYDKRHTKKDTLATSFTFLHEHTTVHPGHNNGTVAISGISGPRQSFSSYTAPYTAHTDKLEDLIQFIDEYHFYNYIDEPRRSFVKGYEYEKTSLLNPFWVKDYLVEVKGEDFDKGREEAKKNQKNVTFSISY